MARNGNRRDSLERASRWVDRSLLLALVAGASLWVASSSSAAPGDVDDDLVPDSFDNCLVIANGPNEASNQVDTDLDGYGNVCDADYDGNFVVTISDFATFYQSFLVSAGEEADFDGDGGVFTTDFSIFYSLVLDSPGPSGLACAANVPCLP